MRAGLLLAVGFMVFGPVLLAGRYPFDFRNVDIAVFFYQRHETLAAWMSG